MINFGIVLFIATTLTFKLCLSTCARAEYKVNGECCPMCAPGNRVYWDCTGDTNTTCVPCPASTYIDEPNRLIICYSCSVCDAGQGLYIQSKCTTIRDTICDVLDGYFCIEDSNSQCRHAIKHSVCKPGQETKTLGTKISDTVCVDCTLGFYSPSGLNCTKWTNCTARNEIQTENGSSVKDITCTPKRRERYGLIFAMVLTSLAWFYTCRSQVVNLKEEKNFSVSHPPAGSSCLNPCMCESLQRSAYYGNVTALVSSLRVL